MSDEAGGSGSVTPPERVPIEPPVPSETAGRQPTGAELIGTALGSAARRAGLDPQSEASTGHVVWHAMGGWRGIAESVIPSLVFVVVFTVTYDSDAGTGNLVWSLGLSVGIAALFTIARLVGRSSPAAAIGGLIATAAAAALALWTGQGRDNYVLGFVTNGAYGGVFLVSALIGWPLIGLAVGWLMGDATAWRADRRKRRVFTWLSLGWAGLFLLRLAVQLPLYLADEVAALGILKIAMGLPLFAPMVAVTWLASRGVYASERGSSEVDRSTPSE